MNKLSPIFFVTALIFITAACAPNRLEKALESQPAENNVIIAAPTPDGRNLQPQLGNANIDISEVVTLLPPDAIRAIWPDEVSDIMVTAAQADAAGTRPTTRVLGVSINGESRAYPIPFMSEHEIVNDEVGGRLIAATW